MGMASVTEYRSAPRAHQVDTVRGTVLARDVAAEVVDRFLAGLRGPPDTRGADVPHRYLTDDDKADALLAAEPNALLIGMMLDRRVRQPMTVSRQHATATRRFAACIHQTTRD